MQFTGEERRLVRQALGEAEEFTAGYYRIPPFRWQQLQYDLLTRQDREWEPLPEFALARVQCLHSGRPRRGQPFDFYRILLNDPSILEAVRRENLHAELYCFLVYILTHEFVHLVRLSSLPDGHPGDSRSSDREESRVQEVSRRILSRAHSGRFQPVLERFCLPAACGR